MRDGILLGGTRGGLWEKCHSAWALQDGAGRKAGGRRDAGGGSEDAHTAAGITSAQSCPAAVGAVARSQRGGRRGSSGNPCFAQGPRSSPLGGSGAGGGGRAWPPEQQCRKVAFRGDQVGAQPQSGAATGAVDMAEGTRSLTRVRSRVFRTWQSEEPGSQRCRLALGTDGCRTAALSQLRQKVPRALGGAAARPAWSQGPTRQQVGPLRPPCGPRPAFPPTEGRFPHGRRGHSRPLGLMLARGQEPSLALGSRVKPPATKSACSWAHRGHP